MPDSLSPWLAVAALIVLAIVCTSLLRWAAGPASRWTAAGWAMLGGAIAGVLLGPTVAGRIFPEQYERYFIGGGEERAARDALIRRHGADRLAAEHAFARGSDIDREEIDRNHLEYERKLDEAAAAWEQAKWRDQQPLRIATLTIAAIVLLIGGAGRVRRGDRRQGWLAPITIGVWSAALPGGLVFVAMTAWWGHSLGQSLMVAAACAIGPWMLTAIDRHAADHAEFGGARMIQTAGRVASLLAIGAAGYAMWLQRGVEGLALISPLLALPLGWFVFWILDFRFWIGSSSSPRKRESTAPLRSLDSGVRGNDSDRRRIENPKSKIQNLLLSALAALVAVKIELFEYFAIWPLLLILLLSDDGRWFGAFVGAMLLGGRRALRTTRLVIGCMSAGPTQLAVAALAAHLWAIPETLLLPLLLGALLIEFTAPARRRFAQRLAEMEVEMSQSYRE